MHPGHDLHRLHLDDHALLHDQIGAEGVLDVDPIVGEPDQPLTVDMQSASPELNGERPLVERLQQTRAGSAMNLDGGVDDPPSDVIKIRSAKSRAPRS